MKKQMDGTKTMTEAGSSSAVAELPLDVWGDIFSRMPFKLVLLCRCVCRAWNALLSRIHHHHHPNPTTPPATLLYINGSVRETSCPCLWRLPYYRMRLRNYLTLAELRLRNGYAVSHTSTVTRTKDRYTFLGGTYDNFLFPVASCHGLVCFVDKSDMFVGNPLLKEDLLVVRLYKTETKAFLYVVGFGFSPRADRYKIIEFVWFDAEPEQPLFLICTVGDGVGGSNRRGKPKVCSPTWRRLLSFPRHFCESSCLLGSHLNAGIHWLVSDNDDSVFISRLDLDTEQFGRIEAPQSSAFNAIPLGDLSLGVSDGHLIICANMRGKDIIDIWVMNQFNFWTKKLVVRSPIPPDWAGRVELLNYGKVEAADREGAVAEVMLLVGCSCLYACTTRGRHMRQLDGPSDGDVAIVHIPSFISIKDVVNFTDGGSHGCQRGVSYRVPAPPWTNLELI